MEKQNLKKIMMKMFEMQINLNKTSTEMAIKQGRIIDWERAIVMETAEAIDSFNWKHWKDINWKNDEDNLFVELVDIWHFVMSLMLSKNSSVFSLDELWEIFSNLYIDNKKIYTNFYNKVYTNEERIVSLEKIIAYCIKKESQNLTILFNLFFEALAINNISLDKLISWYFIKNYLNEFRQLNWYKENMYLKYIVNSEWINVEDNTFAMSKFLGTEESKKENFKDIFFNTLKKEWYWLIDFE